MLEIEDAERWEIDGLFGLDVEPRCCDRLVRDGTASRTNLLRIEDVRPERRSAMRSDR